MTKNNKKGFTIIEVVLVLAIAGLIFLMVFIALPALQRSQRNTRRRQDMARILTAVTDYQANNSKLPWRYEGTTWIKDNAGLVTKYIIGADGYTYKDSEGAFDSSGSCSDEFCDPDGSSYRFDAFGNVGYFDVNYTIGEAKNKHQISAVINAKCSGNESSPVENASGAGQFAIIYELEGGAVYCGDNQ